MMTDTLPRPFDPGKPVQTRGGDPARVVCTDGKGPEARTILALVATETGAECVKWMYADGQIYRERRSLSDLVNVPVRREGWVAHWAGSGGCRITSALYPTREKAEQQTAGVCDIAVVISRVEWEE